MGHVVKDLHAYHKTLLVDLFIEIEDRAIVNLYSILVIQLFVLMF